MPRNWDPDRDSVIAGFYITTFELSIMGEPPPQAVPQVSQSLSPPQRAFLWILICSDRSARKRQVMVSNEARDKSSHRSWKSNFLPFSLERLGFGPLQAVRSQLYQLNGDQRRVSLTVQCKSHSLILSGWIPKRRSVDASFSTHASSSTLGSRPLESYLH